MIYLLCQDESFLNTAVIAKSGNSFTLDNVDISLVTEDVTALSYTFTVIKKKTFSGLKNENVFSGYLPVNKKVFSSSFFMGMENVFKVDKINLKLVKSADGSNTLIFFSSLVDLEYYMHEILAVKPIIFNEKNDRFAVTNYDYTRQAYVKDTLSLVLDLSTNLDYILKVFDITGTCLVEPTDYSVTIPSNSIIHTIPLILVNNDTQSVCKYVRVSSYDTKSINLTVKKKGKYIIELGSVNPLYPCFSYLEALFI